jgi:hypothetical protein
MALARSSKRSLASKRIFTVEQAVLRALCKGELPPEVALPGAEITAPWDEAPLARFSQLLGSPT